MVAQLMAVPRLFDSAEWNAGGRCYHAVDKRESSLGFVDEHLALGYKVRPHTLAPSPNLLSLAMQMASAMSLARKTEATGPNNSSSVAGDLLGMFESTVGSKKLP